MNNDSIFLAVKAAVAAAIGAFGAAFGWLGWLVLAWVVCMVLDYVTGTVAAMRTGEWSSAVARSGIFHKVGMVVVIIVAALADCVISVMLEQLPLVLPFEYTVLITPVILIWYIFTELGSVAENAVKMGASVPAPLISILKAGKQAAEAVLPDVDDTTSTQDKGSSE